MEPGGGGRGRRRQRILSCFPLSWDGWALHTPLQGGCRPSAASVLSPSLRRRLRQVWESLEGSTVGVDGGGSVRKVWQGK